MSAVEEHDEHWEDEFASIEEAWLAGRHVGDPHEDAHFRSIVQLLRRTQPALKDEARLLRELGSVRAYFGEGFEYCLLDSALKRMHRPTLNPVLLAVRMAEIKRRHRRSH